MPSGTEWFLIFGAAGMLLIVPMVLYVFTLYITLKAVAPENRKMEPMSLWLLLIPVFGLVWHFIVVGKMADSIKAELASENNAYADKRPAYDIGLAMCILSCLCFIPGINVLAVIGALVCWIIYWVRMITYKGEIARQKSTRAIG